MSNLLCMAIMTGDLKIVETFLNIVKIASTLILGLPKNHDNAKQNSTLVTSIRYGNHTITEWLLEKGADPTRKVEIQVAKRSLTISMKPKLKGNGY